MSCGKAAAVFDVSLDVPAVPVSSPRSLSVAVEGETVVVKGAGSGEDFVVTLDVVV